MTEWTNLPGFPLDVGGTRMPIGSRARFVNGEMADKGGKPVILSGLKAFVQALEQRLIEACEGSERETGAMLAVALAGLFVRTHVERIEFVRYRGTEVDLECVVAKLRGKARVHFDITGPLGKYADAPLPTSDAGQRNRKSAAPQASKATARRAKR